MSLVDESSPIAHSQSSLPCSLGPQSQQYTCWRYRGKSILQVWGICLVQEALCRAWIRTVRSIPSIPRWWYRIVRSAMATLPASPWQGWFLSSNQFITAEGRVDKNALSLKPLASIIRCAWSIMFDISIFQKFVRLCRRIRSKQKTYPHDVWRPSLGGEHAQNPCPAPNIQHGLALEQVRVAYDGWSVWPSSNCVLQHLFMDAYPEKDISEQQNSSLNIRVPKCAYESA